MIMLRLNTEKKIEHNNFKIKIGTINRLNPESIYFECRSFITPTIEKSEYFSDISIIKSALKYELNKELRDSDIFYNKYIIDFNIPTSRMECGKSSFLSFQITLQQKSQLPFSLKQIKDESSNMITHIIDQLSNTIIESGFTMKKTKK